MKLRDAFYRDLPNEQSVYDYGARTDGNPVYAGFAKLGVAESVGPWIMIFSKYNVDGTVSKEYRLEGVWSNRAVLFLPYV